MHYNGTMMNVTSSTTTLTFTAPSLPDGVFTGTIVVMVMAIGRHGIGPASEPETAVFTGKYIDLVSAMIFQLTAAIHIITLFMFSK